MEYKNEIYYCQSELITRGWTMKMIEKYLPKPDLKRHNQYNSSAKIKYWKVENIEYIEKNNEEVSTRINKNLDAREKRQEAEENKYFETR